jgi:hypothetical protein
MARSLTADDLRQLYQNLPVTRALGSLTAHDVRVLGE